MARTDVILPRADAACGKSFYSDRRTADGHRIALEIWNRATGHERAGYRLAVFRCRRCGGFHVGQKPIGRKPMCSEPSEQRGDLDRCDPRESATPVRRIVPSADW